MEEGIPLSPPWRLFVPHLLYPRHQLVNYYSEWSLTKIDNKFHPLKILNIINNKVSLYSSKGKGIIARQMLDDKYIRNGVFYIFKVKSFMK